MLQRPQHPKSISSINTDEPKIENYIYTIGCRWSVITEHLLEAVITFPISDGSLICYASKQPKEQLNDFRIPTVGQIVNESLQENEAGFLTGKTIYI